MKPSSRHDEHRMRRMLLVTATLVTFLALVHHVDHVIRGELVEENGLDSDWNHSGWPFRASVTPFTFSLAVYAILVPGIVLTLKRRVGALYWIVSSIVLAAIIVVVHFVPGPKTETPRVIYDSYAQSSGRELAGVLAVADVFAILLVLAILLALAVRGRRSQSRAQ